MHKIEDAIDDWKVFGQNSDFSQTDGKKLDGIYWREVATKIRAPLVYQHYGLYSRGIRAIKSKVFKSFGLQIKLKLIGIGMKDYWVNLPN